MLRGKSKFLQAVIILGLLGAIGGTGILIFEAATPGKQSANQSTAVGTQIASIINEHETNDKDVEPTSVSIKNPVASLKVGDTYLLETEVLPEDTTFPALSFASSVETVARISGDGLITALSAGSTTISITNIHNNELTDSFDLSVAVVPVTDIAISISGSEVLADGSFRLSTERTSYSLQATVSPDDATEKTVTYATDRDDYLQVTGSTIRLKADSGDEYTVITATCGDFSKDIHVYVEEYVPDVIALTSVRFSANSLSLGIGESKSTSLVYTPKDADEATMSAFTFASGDTSVATVNARGNVTAVAAGDTTITATLKSDPSITAELPVTVSYIDIKPTASMSLRLSSRLRVSLSATASISGWNPSNATAKLKKYYRFFSADSAIAAVNETSGKVTAKAVGNTAIRAEIYGSQADYAAKTNPVRTLTAPIEIFDSGTVVSFELNAPFAAENGDGTLLIHQGTTYNLKQLTHKNLQVNGSPDGISINLGYEVEWQSEDIAVSKDGDNLTVTGDKPGYVRIRATDANSGVSSSVTFLAVKPLTYADDGGSTFYVGDRRNIVFDTQEGIVYNLRYEGDPFSYLLVTNDLAASETMTFEAVAPGQSTMVVTPYYEGVALEPEILQINLNAVHKLATDFAFTATPTGGESLSMDNEEPHRIIVGTRLSLAAAYTPFAEPTAAALGYVSSNRQVAYITGSTIVAHKVGDCLIQAKESVSGVTHQMKLKIVNQCALSDTKPFKFRALGDANVNKVDSDDEGNPVFLKSFSYKLTVSYAEGTTFKNPYFTSLDESVLIVGQDGSVSALSVGKTKIRVEFNDGVEGSVNMTYEIDVSVRKRAVIENISSFNALIRKLLGHFGAFLILGIATSMFFLLGFQGKAWYWSIPTNIGYGFFLAGLTELIQLYTEGRVGAWKDVGIDFGGYCISAVLFTAVLLLFHFLKKRKAKKKVLEAAAIDEIPAENAPEKAENPEE